MDGSKQYGPLNRGLEEIHLAAISRRGIQHSEEEAKLTREAELLRALMALHGTANWLQEVQHLPL